jgi:hypothetical protein
MWKNERTALDTAHTVYLLNGYRFEYDEETRAILKRVGTDETTVGGDDVLEDDIRREPVLRVAKADRDGHRDIYDALEDEWVSPVSRVFTPDPTGVHFRRAYR